MAGRIFSEDLEDQFKREFLELCDDVLATPVVLELDLLQAWVLFSQLQVALRHPKNVGEARRIAHAIASELEKKLPMGPAMAEVAKRGWDPQYDV